MGVDIREIGEALEEIRKIAHEAVNASHQVENEAVASTLLRHRMMVVALTAEGLLNHMESPEPAAPTRARDSEDAMYRQSTEESIKLAFSCI